MLKPLSQPYLPYAVLVAAEWYERVLIFLCRLLEFDSKSLNLFYKTLTFVTHLLFNNSFILVAFQTAEVFHLKEKNILKLSLGFDTQPSSSDSIRAWSQIHQGILRAAEMDHCYFCFSETSVMFIPLTKC